MVKFDINLEFSFFCWLISAMAMEITYILRYDTQTLTQLFDVSLYFLANQPI